MRQLFQRRKKNVLSLLGWFALVNHVQRQISSPCPKTSWYIITHMCIHYFSNYFSVIQYECIGGNKWPWNFYNRHFKKMIIMPIFIWIHQFISFIGALGHVGHWHAIIGLRKWTNFSFSLLTTALFINLFSLTFITYTIFF